MTGPSAQTAVIFDLDGTLINSEPLYRKIDEDFLESRGITVSPSIWDDLVGLGGPRAISLLKEKYGLEGTVPELIREKDFAYLNYARGRTEVFPPMRELILQLHLAGVKLAVATSSRRSVMDVMLAETGLSATFSVRVSADDVASIKPDPEPFLLAAKLLGVQPETCWVIEDSQYGIEAAEAAHMRAIALPEPGHEELPSMKSAILVVKGGAANIDPAGVIETMDIAAATWANVPSDLQANRPDGLLAAFREAVYRHYRDHGREMPWRDTDDPYRILLSEFMLQQTQVSRVAPRYHEFLNRFPAIEDLAAAPLGDVLSIWQGLGYNRRAKNLHDSAKLIASDNGGKVPRSIVELVSLPGIGPYTAGAIRSFAFNRPAVFMETNIRRVYIQSFFGRQEVVHDREIFPLIGVTLDHENPRRWYHALMDFGASLPKAHGNANRRSAHYSRQKPLKGSVREVRGRIIRALAEKPLGLDELERRCGPLDKRFQIALDALAAEGMVLLEGRTARLP